MVGTSNNSFTARVRTFFFGGAKSDPVQDGPENNFFTWNDESINDWLTVDKLIAHREWQYVYPDEMGMCEKFCRQNSVELERRILSEMQKEPPNENWFQKQVLMIINPDMAFELAISRLERMKPAQDWPETPPIITVLDMLHDLHHRFKPEHYDDRRVLMALIPHLNGRLYTITIRAARLLYLLELPEVPDTVRTLLRNPHLKMNAAGYLAEMGDPAGWPALRDYIENDPFWYYPHWWTAVQNLVEKSRLDLREEIFTVIECSLFRIAMTTDQEDENSECPETIIALLHILGNWPIQKSIELMNCILVSNSWDGRIKTAVMQAKFGAHLPDVLPSIEKISAEMRLREEAREESDPRDP